MGDGDRCEWVRKLPICCCQLNFLLPFLLLLPVYLLFIQLVLLPVRFFCSFSLAFAYWRTVQSFIIAFDGNPLYVRIGSNLQQRLHQSKSVLQNASGNDGGVQLQPDAGDVKFFHRNRRRWEIKTRKNLLHLKMLSTFQDWPAAGTITANGNTEAESMCEKCICGSEYFIQAFFGDVPCALSSPSRSRALATHSCFFYVIRLLCLHTFMWHKS